MSNAKSDFLIVFWSPFSPLRGQVFAIFFLAIKKKINKNGLNAYIPPSGKCESTYLCTRVCETNLSSFIYLFNFFLDLRYNVNTSICRPIVKRACFSLTLN